MSHTPGPWNACPRHVDNDGTQDEISGLGWDIEGPRQPQLRGQFAKAADAYLIAAAPDLLEAAEKAIRILNEEVGHFGVRVNFPDLRNAIDKAKGEA